MATYDSTQMTLFKAAKLIQPNLKGNFIRSSKGLVTTAAAAATSDTMSFCTVPSNAILTALYVTNTALGGSGAINLGLYRQDGTAISATFFASARSTVSAAHADVFGANATLIPKREQPLWQMAGLTSDPGEQFWIQAVVSTGGASAGTIAVNAEYTV